MSLQQYEITAFSTNWNKFAPESPEELAETFLFKSPCRHRIIIWNHKSSLFLYQILVSTGYEMYVIDKESESLSHTFERYVMPSKEKFSDQDPACYTRSTAWLSW